MPDIQATPGPAADLAAAAAYLVQHSPAQARAQPKACWRSCSAWVGCMQHLHAAPARATTCLNSTPEGAAAARAQRIRLSLFLTPSP